MPTEIVQGDVVAPETRRLKLGDQTFKVPPTPTLRYMFYMRRLMADVNNIRDDDVVECFDETIAFLERYNSSVDRDALTESCTVAEVILFYSRCFGENAEEGEPEPGPTKRIRGGAASSTKARSRSRSST